MTIIVGYLVKRILVPEVEQKGSHFWQDTKQKEAINWVDDLFVFICS
jgi:hypothetical protein